ncbi:MAG: LysM peptidoglycan-binding domain-containing protein [Verrucomicrobiota bacterium]|nr:LysM peptidoglycan-binding domain-containing protein [Verrucomicrobiota bacterium]
MRWRLLLGLSLAGNLLLAAGWLWFTPREPSPLTRSAILPGATNGLQIKTAVVVRRQFFSWQEVESDAYPTYIKNLREIGCPEQTIRDIIIADVNALFARRRAVEIFTPDQQWWRTEPDPVVVQAATAKDRELETERRDLLSTLLGPNWEGGDLVSLPRPSRPPIPLDGPILGPLPTEVKQSVEQISMRAADRLEAYLAAQRQAGNSPDPAELSRFRQQTRKELAAVLTPVQLEEYLLRYSDNARALRTDFAQLKFFNATPDEFRSVFRTLDSLNDQLAQLDDSTPQGALQRDALVAQGETALKLALGEQRYAEYRRLHDDRYREAYAEAQKAGAPETASALYEIKLAAAEELARIKEKVGLTDEQRAIELKQTELEQLRANAQALGQEDPTEPVKPAPKAAPATTHIVANGEGLDRLARLYGVQPSDLRAANPGINFDKLKAGDKVSVPFSLLYPMLPPRGQ